MRLIEWRFMDQEQVVDIIVKYNIGPEVTPSIARRIRNKLLAMPGDMLWDHVEKHYLGMLYAPEPGVPVRVREWKRKEREPIAKSHVVKHESKSKLHEVLTECQFDKKILKVIMVPPCVIVRAEYRDYATKKLEGTGIVCLIDHT